MAVSSNNWRSSIQLQQELDNEQKATIRTQVGESQPMHIGKGVRQGCILSPALFNLFSEKIVRDAFHSSKKGIRIGGRRINNLRYADDTTLIADNIEYLKQLLEDLRRASTKAGLSLNVSKTKVMGTDPFDNFTLQGEEIEKVENFIFLGASIMYDGNCNMETKRRLTLGRSTMQSFLMCGLTVMCLPKLRRN